MLLWVFVITRFSQNRPEGDLCTVWQGLDPNALWMALEPQHEMHLIISGGTSGSNCPSPTAVPVDVLYMTATRGGGGKK